MYNDFVENDAFELRGLTFIRGNDGNFKRFIALNKFFNVNEVDDWCYDNLVCKQISHVQEKLDGSLISFVRFPDGSLYAKSKMSLCSTQSSMAQDILDSSPKLSVFINTMIDSDMHPIFELTSDSNQVVVQYESTRLTLIQIRKENGTYVSISEMSSLGDLYDIDVCATVKVESMDKLMAMKSSNTSDIEGWIVVFTDGQIAKIKTDTYVQKHGVVSALQENVIIRHVVSGTIDDITSMLNMGSQKRTRIDEITKVVRNKMDDMSGEILPLVYKYSCDRPSSERKDVVSELRSVGTPWFSIVMKMYGVPKDDVLSILDSHLKDHVRRKTYSLEDSRKFLN